MSVMASMLFSAYKWLLLEEWSGISINCAQQTRQVLTVSAQLIRQCSGQASTQAHSQRWFSCAKQATVQRVVGPLDVASRSQSRQPSEISRQAAIRHAQARSRARPSSGGFMRLQKREHKTEYKTLSRSVFCKIRILQTDFRDPDFTENRS
jgi:predicted phage gp36 major capsid-like protein